MKTLDQLAIQFGADKSSAHHGYCEVYSRYFEHLRNEPIVLLELGFGGYHYPDRGGAGAKMWAEYFPNATVITTDIHAKNTIGHNRIFFYQGDQTDGKFLFEVVGKTGRPDIIIDDGSHCVDHVRASFMTLFPLLKNGGIYVVEDVESSYSSLWGYNGNENPNDGETTMNYFKRLTDQLNHKFFAAEYHNEYAGKLEYIHFYKNLIIVKKL